MELSLRETKCLENGQGCVQKQILCLSGFDLSCIDYWNNLLAHNTTIIPPSRAVTHRPRLCRSSCQLGIVYIPWNYNGQKIVEMELTSGETGILQISTSRATK